MNRIWISALLGFALLAAQPARTTLLQVDQFYDVESPQKIAEAQKRIDQLGFEELTEKDFSSNKVLLQYSHIDPDRFIPNNLLEPSVLYFDKNKSRFSNQRYIAVVDLGVRSDQPRFYLINMETGQVDRHFTTHGVGSDKNNDGIAETFGNIVNSGASSLGPIRTGEVYYGKFNRSLRLDGLSRTNNRMRQRAVTLHGWDHVKEQPIIQGLTYGCLTFEWSIKDSIIDKLKNGAFIFVGQAK